MKTIDINAASYTDVYGNTYLAAELVVNYGISDEKVYKTGVVYGYGDCYIFHCLQMIGFKTTHEVRKAGIIFRYNMTKGRKKDLSKYL